MIKSMDLTPTVFYLAVSNASASSIVLDDEESMETSEQVNIED